MSESDTLALVFGCGFCLFMLVGLCFLIGGINDFETQKAEDDIKQEKLKEETNIEAELIEYAKRRLSSQEQHLETQKDFDEIYDAISSNLSKIVPLFISFLFLFFATILTKKELFDGYYAVMRLIVCATCIYSVVKFKHEYLRWIFGVFAVLYNPLFLVSLEDKSTWCVANVITIIYMFIALFVEIKNDNK